MAYKEEDILYLTKHQQSLINYYLPKNEVLADIADFFSIFSDATRVKLLSALSIAEMCVTDLCLMVQMPQSTVSHQLKSLRVLKMVKCRRIGKIIYYSIANKYISEVLDTGITFLGY